VTPSTGTPGRGRSSLRRALSVLALALALAVAGAPAGAAEPGGTGDTGLSASVRADLQEDLADALIAGALLALGLAAGGLSLAREGSTARSFRSLASFCVLYAVRLVADTDALAPLAGLPPGLTDYVTAFLTYVLPIPMYLFVQTWLGPGWGGSLRWLLRIQVAYAGSAIVIDLLRGPGTAMPLNNPLVLLAFAALVVNVTHRIAGGPAAAREALRSRDFRVMAAGSAAIALLAVNENLADAGLLPWRWSYEPIGLLAFVAALGYVVASRFVGGERQLVALSQEMETARRIQAAILPRATPDLPGLSLAARYRPMASVGGDFYDFLPVEGQRLGLLIADVSGHGVPAALIASMVKIALAAQAERAAEPAALLAGMNRILCGNLERSFVTAAYLFVDRPAGRVLYASAGHPPLLHWSAAAGAVREVRLDALPLGRFRRAAYPVTEIAVAPGDRLLAYTDGVVEAPGRDGEPFGDGRLAALLAGAADLSPDGLADRILEQLAAWPDAGRLPAQAPADDITLLAVGIEG